MKLEKNSKRDLVHRLINLLVCLGVIGGCNVAPPSPKLSEIETQAQIDEISKGALIGTFSAPLQIKGLDLLGLAKYCDNAYAGFPSGFALGAFFDTFGDVTKCLDRFIRGGKTSN